MRGTREIVAILLTVLGPRNLWAELQARQLAVEPNLSAGRSLRFVSMSRHFAKSAGRKKRFPLPIRGAAVYFSKACSRARRHRMPSEKEVELE